MTTVLFPSAANTKKSSTLKKHYPVLLGDIVRGCSDSIDALELFGKLLRGQDNDAASVGFMAFDAHVGDTCCQLRAGMMREAFTYHHQLLKASGNLDENPAWLDQMVMSLKLTKDAAQDACFKMTKKKVRPVAMGMNAKTESGEKIAEALGWVEPEVTMWEHRPSASGATTPTSLYDGESEAADSVWSSQTSSLNNSVFSTRASSPVRAMRNSLSSASLAASCSGGCDSDALDKKLAQTSQDSDAIKWNLLDPKTMVRFIVYTYVLSKYKNFCRLENVVGCRLDAGACAKFGEDLIAPYNDVKNLEYAAVKTPKRVEMELHALQVFLSELSTSWLSTLAARSSFMGWDGMMSKSLRRAVTKHASMPTYLGFLLMREDLSNINEQIILVDRHFCKDGFHSNIFIAHLESDSDDFASVTKDFSLPKVNWRLESAPADYLNNIQNDTQPHVVIMGNSIEGTYGDYMIASHPDAVTSHKHETSCAENDSHVAELLVADHDRLAVAFMATHKHFAFPLSDPKENEAGEGRVIYDIMEQEQPGLGDQWENAKNEAINLGCVNDNLRIFSWQHIVLETRNRLAKKVADRKDMMPLSADISVIATPETPKFPEGEDEASKPNRKERRRKPQQPVAKIQAAEEVADCPTPRGRTFEQAKSTQSIDAVVIGHPSSTEKSFAVVSVVEVSAVEEPSPAVSSASATSDSTAARL